MCICGSKKNFQGGGGGGPTVIWVYVFQGEIVEILYCKFVKIWICRGWSEPPSPPLYSRICMVLLGLQSKCFGKLSCIYEQNIIIGTFTMWFISVGVSWIWKWRLSLENKIGIRKSQWQKILELSRKNRSVRRNGAGRVSVGVKHATLNPPPPAPLHL